MSGFRVTFKPTVRWVFTAIILGAISCAHKETSSDAKKKLDTQWEKQIGVATKAQLIEDFGRPEWCRKNETGEETCRFYRKKGTRWVGEEKLDKKNYESFDEVLADFGYDGKLKNLKTSAQR
jgi:hypothetical protein